MRLDAHSHIPVLRFAPSPNGALHLGHAYSALCNQRLADETGGRLLLRLEDLDRARCKPAAGFIGKALVAERDRRVRDCEAPFGDGATPDGNGRRDAWRRSECMKRRRAAGAKPPAPRRLSSPQPP